MTNTNTVERLRELRAKATEGPWETFSNYYQRKHHFTRAGKAEAIMDKTGNEIVAWAGFDGQPNGEVNAALIVEAINALPALLDAVEALTPLLSETYWLAIQATKRGDVWKDEQWVRDSSVGRAYTKATEALATLKGEG
jgi:hypothetical protein